MAAAVLSTQQAVERAIRLAQDAVKADEAGDLEAAIAMYRESVELIKLGLQVQREVEEVDNTVLHKYSKLYSDRIAELSLSIGPPEPPPRAPAISVDSGAGSSSTSFAFEDAELKSAVPPGPAPSGADEWRRPFWLMRILRASMQSGGYLSADSRVFVPRRVWVQKGARFTAMAAKLECAQCLIAELTRMRTVDHRQPAPLLRELEKFGDTLDALQNSLARLLPAQRRPAQAGPAWPPAAPRIRRRNPNSSNIR